jgi:hypothetical protein
MLKKDAMIVIDAIEKSGYKPTDWELEFLADMKRCETYTIGQQKKLSEVYDKAHGGGIYVKREKCPK